MNAYLAVQQGSIHPPQFVHMTYKAQSDNDNSSNRSNSNITKIALIGKGLTFDSGGYNIKVINVFIYVILYVLYMVMTERIYIYICV
jgi:leucyl aminopeptidase